MPWADLVNQAYFQRVQLWAAGFYRTEGLHWDSTAMHGSPFKYFAYGAAATEVEVDGFTGEYRTRRVDIVHDVGDSLSPLVDLGQVEGAFVQGAGWLTLEDLRWDEGDGPTRGRLATQAASTYKLPSFSEMPEDFHVALLERAHEDGAVYGSKAVGEPPLMLAFSVREALREAAAAFGPPGVCVDLASPATPEAVWWALDGARRRSGHGHVSEGAPGVVPDQPDRRPAPAAALRAGGAARHGRVADVGWLDAVERLRRDRLPGVLVTLVAVRGHAPREAGAKMVVGTESTWGSIGGGNLEATAVDRAREMLVGGIGRPQQVSLSLSHAGTHRARPPVLRRRGDRPARAAGRGAVGRRVRDRPRRARAGPHPGPPRPRPAPRRLAGRAAALERLAPLDDAVARVQVHHAVLPELVLGGVPRARTCSS